MDSSSSAHTFIGLDLIPHHLWRNFNYQFLLGAVEKVQPDTSAIGGKEVIGCPVFYRRGWKSQKYFENIFVGNFHSLSKKWTAHIWCSPSLARCKFASCKTIAVKLLQFLSKAELGLHRFLNMSIHFIKILPQ